MSRYTQWRPRKWYLWNISTQKKYGDHEFTSMTAALKFRVSLTKGKRDAASNGLRAVLRAATDELRKKHPEHYGKP